MAIAILAMAAGFLGIKIKETIDFHRFESSVSALATDLKRIQSLALSYQSEFRLEIKPDDKRVLTYLFSSDEPSYAVRRLPRGKLHGIDSLRVDGQKLQAITLTILPSGRISPNQKLGFLSGEKERWIDMRHPLQIKVSNQYSEKE